MTPVARAIADANGLDPATLRGSGASGRVMKDDVLDRPRGRAGGCAPAPFRRPSLRPGPAPGATERPVPARSG